MASESQSFDHPPSESRCVADILGAFLNGYEQRLGTIEAHQMTAAARLDDIRSLLMQLIEQRQSQRPEKAWFTPVEVAEMVGKRPYTVREWCRLRRIDARKRPGGRGDADEWEISAIEVDRYLNHGLLPIPTKY